jgi:glycosyltransferase involved in cell wall biosynthesis
MYCARALEQDFEVRYIVNKDVQFEEGATNLIHFSSKPFGLGEQLEFFRLLNALRDRQVVLHSLNFNVPIFPLKNVHQIVHFYDVLSATGEFRTFFHRLAYNTYVWSLRHHYVTILAQSEFTAKEIAKYHPFHEVIICPHGYSNYIKPRNIDLKAEYGLGRPYFLYMGLNKPRKNLDGLLAAYCDALKKNPEIAYDLVICGPIFDRTSMGFDICSAVNTEKILAGRVHLLGFIPEEHLYAIYHNANMYVVPSHLESGFSYPALEALTAGTPVLLNQVDMYNFSSKSGVYFFDGQSPRGANGLKQVLADMLSRPHLDRVDPDHCDVVRRFNWDSVKDTMRGLYQRS